MTHSTIADVTQAVTIQRGAVVSKVVHRGDGLEMTASRAALVQVLSGRLRPTLMLLTLLPP